MTCGKMETIKLMSGLEYYRDMDNDGVIVMVNPKTIDRYIEIESEAIKKLNQENGFNSYDEMKVLIANECDPQEVYFHEFNNFECMYAYDGDEEAIRKVIDFFGVDVAKNIKRYDVVHSIESIMTPRWIKHTRMMLDRLVTDCDYYLGAGNRNAKCLWAGDEKAQISEMRKLLAKLPTDEQPSWLSNENINEYERKMIEQ